MKHNTRHWACITAGILSLAGYASAATLGSEKYSYDASGNIIEKSIDGKVTKMAYDQANRLVGREADGQSKETTAYDAAGRPVAERNADGQPTRSMAYGYSDKVLETQTRDSKAGFYYNAEGQLVGKNVDGTVSTYTWDGNVLAADGAEAFANEAHISGGVPVLASGTNVVVSDHIGNTLVSGEKQFASTAYGEGLEDGRFTGKTFVKELGNYVFQNRLYSPETNRWNAADPSGYPDGCNNYKYVDGDPISRIDPLGLIWSVVLDTGDVTVPAYKMTVPFPTLQEAEYTRQGSTGSYNTFNVDIKAGNLTQGTWPAPKDIVFLVTISCDATTGAMQAQHSDVTSISGTNCAAGIRVNYQGVTTKKMSFQASGAVAAGTGTVTGTGWTDGPNNASAQHSGPGVNWDYGQVSYKAVER